jgi:hypothetical protein
MLFIVCSALCCTVLANLQVCPSIKPYRVDRGSCCSRKSASANRQSSMVHEALVDKCESNALASRSKTAFGQSLCVARSQRYANEPQAYWRIVMPRVRKNVMNLHRPSKVSQKAEHMETVVPFDSIVDVTWRVDVSNASER